MRYFFYVSWFAQLLVGIGFIAISFVIQFSVLQPFLKTTIMTLMLVLLLQTAKVTTIIWHRYFLCQRHNEYVKSLRSVSLVFKAGLMGVSVLCSIVYLSNELAASEHVMIDHSLSLIKTWIHWQLDASLFVFVLSVIVSVLIELGVLLAFETATVSIQSLMQKQQQYELEKHVLKEQVRTQQEAENIKHQADIEAIQCAAERTLDKVKIKMAITE